MYYTSYDPLSGPDCISAGYTGCCVPNITFLECQPNGGLCFCDMNCHKYNTCCSDIAMTCPLGGEAGSVVRLCTVNLEIFVVPTFSENIFIVTFLAGYVYSKMLFE